MPRGGARPHRKKRMSLQKRKAAKAIGQGESVRGAARKAGLRSKRALAGVTVTEWLRQPEFAALAQKYAEETMSGAEWEARNAKIARYELPSKIRMDGHGRIVDMECDVDQAMLRLGRALGKVNNTVSGPGGGPIPHEHRFSEMSDEDLQRELAKKAAEAGLRVQGA